MKSVSLGSLTPGQKHLFQLSESQRISDQRARSPAHAQAKPEDEHNGSSKEDSATKTVRGDDAQAARGSFAPRLGTIPHEEIAQYVALGNAVCPPAKAGKGPATGKPQASTAAGRVEDMQASWGSIWQCLRDTSTLGNKAHMSQECESYFNTASKRLSHDIPLLQVTLNRFALHASSCAHEKVLGADLRQA